MSADWPLVYVIILNWNGWRDTAECVESCRRLTYPRFCLLVVDNGSTDGSEEQLHARFPDVPILQTGKNLGFAGGNNAGIRHALGQRAEFIWLLNNDTVVDPEALTALVRTVRADERIGIAGSKVYYYDDRRRLNCVAGRVSRWTAFPFNVGRNEEDRGQFDALSDVDYVLGCSCLLRTAAILEAGLMDDRFFLYFEDTDWNFRIRRKGWRIVLSPLSLIWHKESRSVGLHSPRMIYYFARNSLLFAQKAMPLILPLTLLRALQLFVLKRLRNRELSKARIGLRGIADFFLRRFGRRLDV